MSIESITSYSNAAEDILLRRALRHIQNGFYIDVGAKDPEWGSVTKTFYDAGWSGINIEPNPLLFDRIVDRRRHDINIEMAVGEETGKLEFQFDAKSLHALYEGKKETKPHTNRHVSLEKSSIHTIPMKKLWSQNIAASQDVNFLRISVGSSTLQVITSADWANNRPWVVIVELVQSNENNQHYQDWETILLNAGYIFAFFDGLNRFYVAKEKKELLAAFKNPLNVAVDQYIPFRAHVAEQRCQETAAELEKVTDAWKSVQEDLFKLQNQKQNLAELEQFKRYFMGRPRPFWEHLLFRSSGKPRMPLRKLFFRSGGQPRGRFKKYVLRQDGSPRSAFFAWMSSSDYQGLRAAVPLPNQTSKLISAIELTQHGKELLNRLQPSVNGKSDAK